MNQPTSTAVCLSTIENRTEVGEEYYSKGVISTSFPCMDNLMLDTGKQLEEHFKPFYVDTFLWLCKIFNMGNI